MFAPRLTGFAVACAVLLATLGAELLAPRAAGAQDVESRYKQAAVDYGRTRATPGATAESWRAVALAFQRIHEEVPRQPRGADSLFSLGLALHEAFRAGGTPADLNGAQAAFERFAAEFPRHALADDCLMHVADIQEHDRGDADAAAALYRRVVDTYANGDLSALARQRLAALRPAETAPQTPARPRPIPAAQPAAQLAEKLLPGTPAPGPTVRAPAPGAEESSRPAVLKRMQVLSALQFTRIILTTSAPVTFRHELASGAGTLAAGPPDECPAFHQ